MTDRDRPLPDGSPLTFDEERYEQLYPDVAEALRRGDVTSGLEHYQVYGQAEGRQLLARVGSLGRLSLGADEQVGVAGGSVPSHSVDVCFMSAAGDIFVVGWFDDTAERLSGLRIECRGWAVSVPGEALARVARDDAQAALGVQGRRDFGFWVVIHTGQTLPTCQTCQIVFSWDEERERPVVTAVRRIGQRELRDEVLAFLASARHVGNPQLAAMLSLDRFVGDQIIALNRAVTRDLVKAPYVERFGPTDRQHKASIVVCLYGKPEFMFVQNALFAGKPGIEEYEWIYVTNSPEITERLLREARIGATVYGLAQTVVALPDNAGFGAANNAAVRCSRTDRILIVNPDVFPMDPAWAAKHTVLVESDPDKTRLFGVPLHYDDGSLMHGGMYFDIDAGAALDGNAFSPCRFVRVEHYGKGAPPQTPQFTRSRPVPAVSGAFMSTNRAWFERVGGFSEDYVFGHYEDADLCLKSLDGGVVPWLHDLRMWHLEGRGSVRLPAHEGGSIVNRWLFSRTWGERIDDELRGPDPKLPIARMPCNDADSANDDGATGQPRSEARV